jgi:transposase-like protein
MEAINLVGVSEAARQIGVHKSTISRQVRDGIIPNHGTETAPLVDVEEAKRARDRGLDRSKQRGPEAPLFGASSVIAPAAAEDEDDAAAPAKPAGGLDYQCARTAREGYQARLAQLELEQKLGHLLDKGEVVDAFFTLGASLREMADTVRVDLAQRFGAEVGAAVGEELRKMLQRIAESFERQFTEDHPADAA